MSTIGECVVERLLAVTAVTNLIGARLYPAIIPQDVAMPAVAYQLIDSQKTASRSGSSHLARSLFQFTCEAETYAGADALADAVRGAWQDCRNADVLDLRIDGALIVNELDEYSEQHATHVVRLDVAIWHSEDIVNSTT